MLLINVKRYYYILVNLRLFSLEFKQDLFEYKIAGMIRNLLLTLGIILLTSVVMYAQEGTLKGQLVDRDTKEPIPFANIIVENKGSQVGGTSSDFDGNYTIKPIPPGKFDVKATFVGYKTKVIQGVTIGADRIRFLDIELEATTETLEMVEIVDY